MIAHDRRIAENTASDRQRLYGDTISDRERSYASVIPAIQSAIVGDHMETKLNTANIKTRNTPFYANLLYER